MVIAKICVDGVTAVASGLSKIPKGIIGATIEVTFGSFWDGLSKTAVIRGAVTKDVLDVGNVVEIPAECVAMTGYNLKVGFYGTAGDTVAIPTIWADLGMVTDAADPSGDTSTDPALPVWAQLQNQVDALKQNGGGGGSGGGGGADGFSPIARVQQTDTGAVITITDKTGTTSATVTNGKDGAKGEKGDTGATGATGPQGPKGDTGAQGPQGEQGPAGAAGPAGYTPEKGKDYFTAADKAEMVEAVLAALPAAEGVAF